MEQIQNNPTKKTERPSFTKLWADVKKYKRLYYKVLPVTFIVAAILTLSMPNYYSCTVMLAPELSGMKSGGSLANLASSLAFEAGISPAMVVRSALPPRMMRAASIGRFAMVPMPKIVPMMRLSMSWRR